MYQYKERRIRFADVRRTMNRYEVTIRRNFTDRGEAYVADRPLSTECSGTPGWRSTGRPCM